MLGSALILDTPTHRAEMPNVDTDEWVQPASLANVILLLLSRAAAVISGALMFQEGRRVSRSR